jgi:RND superfamily putative drug exporter
MAVWDGIVTAVPHRRSWAIALLIAAASEVFMALAGSNTSADKPPLLVPLSAESARAATLSKSLPGEDQVRAILVVSRRDGSALTPGDLTTADSARQRVLMVPDVAPHPSHRSGDWAGTP